MDLNATKFSYNGTVLSWDEKDDVQRLLSLLESDASDALNTALEYKFVMDFTIKHHDYMNRAAVFWGEVLRALRFALIMKAARLFDESKDAIGLKKIFNILEQSIYREEIAQELRIKKSQYESNRKIIDEIRTIRDKIYAHNDKYEYQFWKHPEPPDLEFEGEVWWRIEDLLRWAKESILSLRTITGDGYPLGFEISNDTDKLLI